MWHLGAAFRGRGVQPQDGSVLGCLGHSKGTGMPGAAGAPGTVVAARPEGKARHSIGSSLHPQRAESCRRVLSGAAWFDLCFQQTCADCPSQGRCGSCVDGGPQTGGGGSLPSLQSKRRQARLLGRCGGRQENIWVEAHNLPKTSFGQTNHSSATWRERLQNTHPPVRFHCEVPDPVPHLGWQNRGRTKPVFKVLHTRLGGWGEKLCSQTVVKQGRGPQVRRERPVSGGVPGGRQGVHAAC